jgi:hypothetical protein
MTAFDISFADTTGYYYFADRSNASVDVINGSNLGAGVVNQIGGFAGQQAMTSISGPDGVLVAHIGGNAILYAGDAGSTLRAFNVNTPTSPSTLSTINTGGGALRVDEMSFAPGPSLLMVANNANAPAFATLINTTTPPGTIVPQTGNPPGKIFIPQQTTGVGMEQSVWDPNTGTFFVSVPSFTSSDPGGLAEINTSGSVINTVHFDTFGITSCSPSGLGLGGSGNLVVGCGNSHTQTVVFNPQTNFHTTVDSVSGSDELWYDPTTHNFYLTGVNAAGDRVIDVFSDTALGLTLLQSIDLTELGADSVNAHSVAVNPLNGDIFVPLEGAADNTLCPNGCVAVFQAPEPSSLPVMIVGLAGLIGLGLRRQFR